MNIWSISTQNIDHSTFNNIKVSMYQVNTNLSEDELSIIMHTFLALKVGVLVVMSVCLSVYP